MHRKKWLQPGSVRKEHSELPWPTSDGLLFGLGGGFITVDFKVIFPDRYVKYILLCVLNAAEAKMLLSVKRSD